MGISFSEHFWETTSEGFQDDGVLPRPPLLPPRKMGKGGITVEELGGREGYIGGMLFLVLRMRGSILV